MIINNVQLPFIFSDKNVRCTLSAVCCTNEDIENDRNALSWLSCDELKKISEFKSKKRKLEYIIGRIAAKHAIKSISSSSKCKVSEINIKNSSAGNPVIENSDYCVSISHSKSCAVGLAFDDNSFQFGIDIEYVNENKLSALKYISGENESIQSNAKELTIAWTMKESLSKAMLCGFTLPFDSFFIKKMESHEGIYTAEYEKYSEYRSIAVICNQDADKITKNLSLAITYDSRLSVEYSDMRKVLKNAVDL